jgi:hypothetical protein
MAMTDDQRKQAEAAIAKVKEGMDTLKGIKSFGPDGHCKKCTCPAFVWRFLSFPNCGRDGCDHGVLDHDVA